ncbi:MAG: metalloregulator ArsR/SmtB family transcription factor [Ilumatobacteraceae bacterium]
MPAAVDGLSRTFAALAHPTRREILSRLREGPLTMGELALPFAMSRPAVSQHIKALSEAGLIDQLLATLADAERWVEEHRGLWTARFDRLDTLLSCRDFAADWLARRDEPLDPHGATAAGGWR